MLLGELPLLRRFFAGWGPGWWEHIERSMQLKLIGDPTPAAVLGWWEGDRPLGVAHYRGNRFGPLAVAEEARGRGIGAAMTLAALSALREAGYADAHFLVGREGVQPFYARLGFTVLRRFRKLRLTL
jgi:GNAT superfamily N-acetyltransferase